MIAGQEANLVYALGALVLMISVLFSFRLRIGQLVKMALGWVAIFAVAIVLFSFRDEASALFSRVHSELTGQSVQELEGSTVVLRQAPDGHFWARVSVNGIEIPFLVDSGATITAMNRDSARQVGIDVDGGGFPVAIGTANGTVLADRAKAQRLQLETIVAHDFPVIVAEEFGTTNVIGMNFLSRLQSWRVEGKSMYLVPPGASDI